MRIYLYNSDFDFCSPNNERISYDNSMSPLHNFDWSKDDTDSSDDSNYHSFDENQEYDLLPDFLEPQQLFSVASYIITQQKVAATAFKTININPLNTQKYN